MHRARLRALVSLAADVVAPAWPLETFVATNPLMGFEWAPFGDATARAATLFRARVLPGSAPHPTPAGDAHETLADWCARIGFGDVPRAIDERTSRWLCAYADRGAAAWPMPHRERGLYRAWKTLARHENTLAASAGAYRAALDALPPRADDALAANLEALQIPTDRWSTYVQRHLAAMPGWAAYVKHLAERSETGIDLLALLAIRTWYERCEVAGVARALGIAPTFPELRDWLLAHPERIAAAPSPADPFAHERALDALEERERAYCDTLLARIDRRVPAERDAPAAQLVFCIDVRSEPLRRAIESSGPYETFGFAGFFGVALLHRAFDATSAVALAPVLLRPSNVVDDAPDDATAAAFVAGADRRNARLAMSAGALGHPLAAFAGVEWFGAFAAARAAWNTFVARRRRAAAPALPLDIGGLPLEERILLAEASLRMMGLTRAFAPLVVLCGHGGATANNAFASALDCGACGGNRGTINARVAAMILNDGAVRDALAARGIAIPATTTFLAAEHETTGDRMTLIDADAPSGARAPIVALARALERASTVARERRAATLPAAPLGASDPQARATDWAQVRPEWGLAGNAAIVIGPRALTRDADLGGRCFLHSYDHAADADGAALEQILTAPLIVAEWINLQYFFATVDPERFGSGDKVLQQPVGGFGVLSGNGGDLRTGLPLQSTTIGSHPYHEPLRLLAVVAAPRARIDAIIARQQVLQRLFDHRWVSLVAIDPVDGSTSRYTGAGRWHPLTTMETPACSQTA